MLPVNNSTAYFLVGIPAMEINTCALPLADVLKNFSMTICGN